MFCLPKKMDLNGTTQGKSGSFESWDDGKRGFYSTNGKLVVWGLVVWIAGIPENERDCYLWVPLDFQTTNWPLADLLCSWKHFTSVQQIATKNTLAPLCFHVGCHLFFCCSKVKRHTEKPLLGIVHPAFFLSKTPPPRPKVVFVDYLKGLLINI